MHWPWQVLRIPRQRDHEVDRRAEEAELKARELERRAEEIDKAHREDPWTQAVRRIVKGG